MKHGILMKTLVMGFLLCTAGLRAYAATNDDTTAGTSTKPTTGTAPVTDVDDMLTNNNLRALSGSKSLWSFASQFNYNGGTLNTPLSNARPNIAGASATTVASDLDGNMSAKYNLGVQDALMAGVGVRWISPLSANPPPGYPGTRTDVQNPFLTYQHIYKWLGIQSVLQVQDLQWTQADQTFSGNLQNIGIDQENAYEIGSTGLTIALSVGGDYQFFSKHNVLRNFGTAANPDIENVDSVGINSLWLVEVAPIIEYQINKTYNFRTVFNYLQYEHYVAMPGMQTVHDVSTQSIGLGCSITRDIFLYPNVQFLPWDNRLSKTNVALAATINLF